MNSSLLAALAEGALVVTPNRRLARVLQRTFDTAQREAGRFAWPTPTILPYPTLLQMLWSRVQEDEASADAAVLLTPGQAGQLWRAVVDGEGSGLLNPRGAAVLAAEAWSLVHAWGSGGESWRAWRRGADETDDAELFARWAEAYLAQLQRAGAHDLALVANLAAARVERLAAHFGAIVLAGFTELTPQQDRLCTALLAAGVDLRRLDTLPDAAAAASRVQAASPRDELAAALEWARLRVLQHPTARIGIVVEDLAARRKEVVALAEEFLCPGTFLPGAAARPAPFEISLGNPLASHPLVVTALDLIALSESRLAAGAGAVLLRSPYLPKADSAWASRATIERSWIEDGRREVSLGDAIEALESSSPELSARWRSGRDALPRGRTAGPREWVDAWRGWLSAAGWPGTRPLDSAEYQAREAWERTLNEFASLGAVTPKLTPARALDALRALAGEAIFQPEGTGAPIQILGVLEGTGLAFDGLWVAGLTADRWPNAPAPNPLLPIAWQRERNLPRSSPAREFAYAQMLTTRFASASPEVVFSSAASADDHELSPSALILAYPERSAPFIAPTWARSIACSAKLEVLADQRAPRLAAGSTAPGGSRIIAAQSECPFQAVARHRLGAEPWPLPRLGLSRQERGWLLHESLAEFWRAVPDRAALLNMPAPHLAGQIAAAMERALVQLPRPRWHGMPAVARAGEGRRIVALLAAWLVLERARPPFAVRQIEGSQTLSLGGIVFRLRLDRVDTLESGGVAILDYKTGHVDSPALWFGERPRAAQLGLYTLAQRATHPELDVRVVAYGQLVPGTVAVSGLASDKDDWPGLDLVADAVPGGDWPALESWWRRRLTALAEEIAQGHAAVLPRESPSPCRSCGLHAVCRIQSVARPQDYEAADE